MEKETLTSNHGVVTTDLKCVCAPEANLGCSCFTRGCIATPVDHTHAPKGISASFPSGPLTRTDPLPVPCPQTSSTLEFKISSMPARSNCLSVYSEMARS